MKKSNLLAALLPLAAMGESMMFDGYSEGAYYGRSRYRKSNMSNKAWNKRKKRIANEKRARAINRK